jgi:hypothetical protein
MGEKKKKEKKEEAAAEAPAADAPKKKSGNVMAMFTQAQIAEFKEAFTMMDQDRDGIINEDDLGNIYQQVGREPDPKQLKAMIKEGGDTQFYRLPWPLWRSYVWNRPRGQG